jgi:hypothetical protein
MPPDYRTLPSLPLAELWWIDRLCEQFEDALRAGARPRVEDFLGAVSEPTRAVL